MVQKRLAAGCRGSKVLVTSHAELKTRNAGGGRLVRRTVTEETVQLELTGVKRMVERNGLLVLSHQVCAALRVEKSHRRCSDSGHS